MSYYDISRAGSGYSKKSGAVKASQKLIKRLKEYKAEGRTGIDYTPLDTYNQDQVLYYDGQGARAPKNLSAAYNASTVPKPTDNFFEALPENAYIRPDLLTAEAYRITDPEIYKQAVEGRRTLENNLAKSGGYRFASANNKRTDLNDYYNRLRTDTAQGIYDVQYKARQQSYLDLYDAWDKDRTNTKLPIIDPGIDASTIPQDFVQKEAYGADPRLNKPLVDSYVNSNPYNL